jgi:seryl-tRNA synthetase
MCRQRVASSLFTRRAWHNSRRPISTESISPEARPTAAPQPTPNLSHIRQNAELYSESARLRNYTAQINVPTEIVRLSDRIYELQQALSGPQEEVKYLQKRLQNRHILQKGLGFTEDANVANEIASLTRGIESYKRDADKLRAEKDTLQNEASELALGLPNLISSQTPTDGKEKVLRYINYDGEGLSESRASQLEADHTKIGEELDLIDFASATTTSGWGFYYLKNEGALLEQALVQYALASMRKRGWKIVTPPSLVYAHIAESCGFHPRDQGGEQQIWQVAQPDKDAHKPRRSLAGTAEIPLAALYAGKDFKSADLPLKVVGSSRCYRAEAGARGVDTKGLYRVHEFTKVEMFAWAEPSSGDSSAGTGSVFDEMVQAQIDILSSLGLTCRVLEMPTSDLGASAYRKIDIEALFPSRLSRDGGWGEVTSASICTDYQSRRLNTRVKGKKRTFTHTFNGTAMAVPRVLAAVLENGWSKTDRTVTIPHVLREHMGGIEKISASGG